MNVVSGRPLCLLLSIVVLALLTGCAPSATVVISLQEIDCSSCGDTARTKLAMAQGVREARFDKLSAELTVDYDPTKSDEMKLLRTVKTTGQKAVVGEGQGSYLADVEFAGELDAKRINAPGEDVDILAHLAPGKVTVVDFGATWCGPCRVIAGAMRDLLASRPDLALRTVDILDWDSPVAQRYLKDSPQLPYVMVFTPKGNQFSVLSGLKIQELISDINRAAAEGAMGY